MQIIAFITEAAPVEQILTCPSVSHRVRRRSRPRADRPPGTMCRSRCRTGTSSNSPSPTSSHFGTGISASPGSRRLSLPQETVQPPRLPAARCAADVPPSTPERARLNRPRRRPRRLSVPLLGVDHASRSRYRPLVGQPVRSGWLGFPRSGRQGRESWRVKVPLPSIARCGRLAYPLLGEVTNRVLRGRKSHGCPGRVERPARWWERPGWRANPGA